MNEYRNTAGLEPGAVDAVLWDVGGVFSPSPFDRLDAWAVETGQESQAVKAALFGPYDRDTDHPWHRLERGEMGLRDCLAEVVREAKVQGVTLDPENPLSFLTAPVDSDEQDRAFMLELARELHAAGTPQAIVTNNVVEFAEMWRSAYDVDNVFDVVIDSSVVGIRKPDPAIYSLALEQLGSVAPDRAVFLDDVASNLTGAAELGLYGILVEADGNPAASEVRRLMAAPD